MYTKIESMNFLKSSLFEQPVPGRLNLCVHQWYSYDYQDHNPVSAIMKNSTFTVYLPLIF